ncbi:MAG: general secretion pathway protein GspK [Bacteriovoracaceae bacterium]|nr:general secretion pathway protein GspK [Bacteriovoracaceae bacterium]
MKKILNNESGVALLMVSTAIVILTMIMMTFTYDSKIHKLQSFNIEDKTKSRMTAEAGLQFAMVRLRLYKEAFNFLQTNQSAADIASQEVINAIWNFPFVYPVPISDKMNQIQKDSLADFMESAILEGNLQLTIENISNRINLNLLRISKMNQVSEQTSEEEEESDASYSPSNQLLKSLQLAMEAKTLTDEDFTNRYYGTDLEKLVNIMVAYVSDPDTAPSPNDNAFQEIPMSPKNAPMASFSEVYSLPNWDDDLVDLIRREFTVHGALMIDLNKITDKTLKLLLPDLMDEDIKDFFEYKNDPQNPVFFNSLDDFKKYWVQQANVIGDEDFTKIFEKFEAQGLKFGPSPTIFKVISEGLMGRASYKLTAYVVMPAKPEPKPVADTDNDGVPDTEDPEPENPDVPKVGGAQTTGTSTTETEQKTQLLEPRIVEIFVN